MAAPNYYDILAKYGVRQGARYNGSSAMLAQARAKAQAEYQQAMSKYRTTMATPGAGSAATGAPGASTGLSGAAGYGGILNQAINEAKAAQAKANAANEARYQELKSGYDNLLTTNQNMYAGLGQEEMAQIDRDAQNYAMRAHKNVVNRGLGSSTISGSMRRGIEREATQQKNLVRERIGEKKIRDHRGITENKFGVIERREDQGPDLNALYGYAAMYGQGQGMQSGGGGGYRSVSYPSSRYAGSRRNRSSTPMTMTRSRTPFTGFGKNLYSSSGRLSSKLPGNFGSYGRTVI